MQALQPSCCTLSLSLSLSAPPTRGLGTSPGPRPLTPLASLVDLGSPFLFLCLFVKRHLQEQLHLRIMTLALTLRLRLFPLCNLCFRFLLLSGQQLNEHYSSHQCSYDPGHTVAPQNVQSSSKEHLPPVPRLPLISPESEDSQTLAN